MTKLTAWPKQSYLDALRPVPGTEVRGAILASYSADIKAIVAALLALVGRDDEDGGGNKGDLAEAIEVLRGKVRILIQRGRLARPIRIPLIAGILDQFVREIDFDERERSWHPKISLVEFANGEGKSAWRLWLGSRNLTEAVNRELGLLLTSNPGAAARNAAPVPGVGAVAERLADHAQLKGSRAKALRKTLDGVHWTQPDKLRVERITLTGGQGTDKEPSPPRDIDEVIAISPFLDGSIVKTIGGWGGSGTKRILLSTDLALAKIASQAGKPLSGFGENLFALDAPAPEGVDPAEVPAADGAPPEEEESEQVVPGLHAKIFAARRRKQLRLWVGSANATERGWSGRNVEVIAEMAAAASVRDGLDLLLSAAHPVSVERLEAHGVPDDRARDLLDQARKAFVAGWGGRLERDGGQFRLVCAKAPHPADAALRLEAGLVTGALKEWPRGEASLALGEYPPSHHTELVQFRLCGGGIHSAWLQRVGVTPGLELERDRHAIARHLGLRGFEALLAALLAGDERGGVGEPWDALPASETLATNGCMFDGSRLTLDAMLACWARDQDAFRRVGARINTYLGPVLALADGMAPDDRKRLSLFQAVWTTVSGELLKDR